LGIKAFHASEIFDPDAWIWQPHSEPSDLVVVLYLYLTALLLGGLLCFLILSILYYILIGNPQESVVIQAVDRWMERCLMPIHYLPLSFVHAVRALLLLPWALGGNFVYYWGITTLCVLFGDQIVLISIVIYSVNNQK